MTSAEVDGLIFDFVVEGRFEQVADQLLLAIYSDPVQGAITVMEVAASIASMGMLPELATLRTLMRTRSNIKVSR